jgi:hypothetical protein
MRPTLYGSGLKEWFNRKPSSQIVNTNKNQPGITTTPLQPGITTTPLQPGITTTPLQPKMVKVMNMKPNHLYVEVTQDNIRQLFKDIQKQPSQKLISKKEYRLSGHEMTYELTFKTNNDSNTPTIVRQDWDTKYFDVSPSTYTSV